MVDVISNTTISRAKEFSIEGNHHLPKGNKNIGPEKPKVKSLKESNLLEGNSTIKSNKDVDNEVSKWDEILSEDIEKDNLSLFDIKNLSKTLVNTKLLLDTLNLTSQTQSSDRNEEKQPILYGHYNDIWNSFAKHVHLYFKFIIM